jgi:hypothetical protein
MPGIPDETSQPIAITARETILPDAPDDWSADLAAAREGGPGPAERLDAARSVAAAHPSFLEAWADLAELAAAGGDSVTAYAFARVGYHRGLDALRGAGWRGAGFVRYEHVSNRGFLNSLAALRDAAAAIGEEDEADRCRQFLAELDPDFPERP